jgi:hypothetical protein
MTPPKKDLVCYYCFVSRDDWPEWCRISADIPAHADYDTWLKNVREHQQGAAAKGLRAVQVDVKPADLLAWCRGHGLNVNARSRARYAAVRGAEIDKE